MDYSEHRKYIHELANTISILDASLSRAITLLSRNHPEAVDEITRLKKADEYSKKTIQVLRDFRAHIHDEINKTEP